MPFTTLYVPTYLQQRAPAQRVYLRRRWNTEWAWQPHLFCQSVRAGIQPRGASLDLHWQYGLIQHPTDDTPQVYPALDILGWFVKVELDVKQPSGLVTTAKFFGQIVEEDRRRSGEQHTGGAWVLSGEQHLLAQGLELLYRRQRIDRSLILKLAGSQAEIRRGLTFNDDNPVSVTTGNRSPGLGADGHYLFTEDLANGRFWSTLQIVEYLHSVFRPLGSSDFDLMNWQLDHDHLTLLPGNDRPRLAAHGRTLGDLFDELMNRRRGLGWQVKVEDDVPGGARGYPFIRPLSLAMTPVDMPDAWTLEPARNQYALHTDQAVQAMSPVVKRSTTAQYDQVRVVGERLRSVFTVSNVDGTLEADWTTAQRDDYNAAASTLGDYPADTDEREAANARFRSRPDLERVFACWKLPSALSVVKDGVGGASTYWLPNADGSSFEQTYRPELRVLSYLPIFEDPGEQKQLMRPLVLVRVHTGSPDKYCPVDRLGQLARVEDLGDGNGHRWSGHVRVSQHEAGFWILTQGKPQHVLASHASDFVRLADGSDDRDPAEFNWRADLLATVCVEAQRHVEAVWPANDTITDRDSVRRLVIEIGEAGRLDYVPGGTVLGLTDDGLLQHQSGAVYLRDDRQRMESLAKQAFVWYQRIRQAVTIPFAGIFTDLDEGDFLVELGGSNSAEPIEAVVSYLEFDLENVRTILQTDYAELDFRNVV